MEQNNNEQFYKEHFFKAIEERFDKVDSDLKDIKENHLQHIYNRLSKIETRIAYYVGGLGVIIVIVDIIIKYYLK